jgi:hypothetical protein
MLTKMVLNNQIGIIIVFHIHSIWREVFFGGALSSFYVYLDGSCKSPVMLWFEL